MHRCPPAAGASAVNPAMLEAQGVWDTAATLLHR